MSPNSARRWLVWASLGISAGSFIFFLIGPTFGYPLTFEQSLRLLEIIWPVFLAYLGSATGFVFKRGRKTKSVTQLSPIPLLDLVVKGPLVVFALATAAALVAFGVSNRSGADAGEGMSVDMLAGILSLVLGLLAVTTSLVVNYLFSKE